MEPATNNASGKIITALIIGLVVGFAAGVFWQDRRSAGIGERAGSGENLKVSAEGEAASTTTAVTGNASASLAALLASRGFIVNDQSAGTKVSVAGLDVKETLWVAIREEKDGKLGNILGARKVASGGGGEVSVELLRPTIAGGTYRAVLYRDAGAPDFNYREDILIEGAEGKFMAK